MTSLRQRLAATDLLVAPGAFDAFTARIIEDLGFGAVYLPGYAMGIHLGVGQPMTTMTEAINVAARVCAAVDVPVILDGGAGFGDPVHVHRLVRECLRVGVAAVHIEDQPYPKRPGYHRGEGALAPTEVAVAKLEAALEARRGSEPLIIARTDALRVSHSLAETVDRACAFAATGIDGLIVLDLTPEQLVQVRRDIPDVPLFWIGAVNDTGPDLAEMADAGFRGALYPFNTTAAICQAVQSTWRSLLEEGRLIQDPTLIADARSVALKLTRMKEYWDIERRWPTAANRTHSP